ncbi:hypothetical protein PRVXT_002249 [Proteinivorax tanatarense]|uniref:Uncharacterized protein n=1 Tax=Proteinivorax tanatarense TaxID=1260629 RepID=A0AAU7VJK8_9FIRM
MKRILILASGSLLVLTILFFNLQHSDKAYIAEEDECFEIYKLE